MGQGLGGGGGGEDEGKFGEFGEFGSKKEVKRKPVFCVLVREAKELEERMIRRCHASDREQKLRLNIKKHVLLLFY